MKSRYEARDKLEDQKNNRRISQKMRRFFLLQLLPGVLKKQDAKKCPEKNQRIEISFLQKNDSSAGQESIA